MSTKVKLTPKDCLYLDDTLTMFCAVKTRIVEEKNDVQTDTVQSFIEEVENVLTAQYDSMKTLLKEASKE